MIDEELLSTVQQKRALLKTVVTFAAILSGLAVGWIALGMSGGGEGWNSAFISASAVLTAPAAGLAWFLRKRRAGTAFALLLVLVNAIILAVLVKETSAEGAGYIQKVWRSIPGHFLVWAVLWFGWQLLAVAALLASLGHRYGRSSFTSR